jgi:hypothetical protein
MLAAAALALSLVVHVYDSAGTSPGHRSSALAAAQAILADAGIGVAWRDGGAHDDASGSAPEPLTIPEIIIRIVIAPPGASAGSLGSSLVDVAQQAGTLGTVYADRVVALAAQSGVDAGLLLGRAMAHEIGHLLLGTTRHAARGLMRGTWTSVELRRDRPWEWALLRDDAANMRRGLAARARRSEPPAAIIARHDSPTDVQKAEP